MLLTSDSFIENGDNITLVFTSDGGFFTGSTSVRNTLSKNFTFLQNLEVNQGVLDFTNWRMVFTWAGTREKLHVILTNIITIVRENQGLEFTFIGGETGRILSTPIENPLPSFSQINTLVIGLVILIALIFAFSIFREVT